MSTRVGISAGISLTDAVVERTAGAGEISRRNQRCIQGDDRYGSDFVHDVGKARWITFSGQAHPGGVGDHGDATEEWGEDSSAPRK